MPNHYCCVLTCKMTRRNAGNDVRFIKFPVDPKLLLKWRAVIGRGPDFPISQSTRICSKHFVSGRRSLNPSSEDYIPSIFPPSEYRKRTLCRGCRKASCICEESSTSQYNPAEIIGAALGNPISDSSFPESSIPQGDLSQTTADPESNDNNKTHDNEIDGGGEETQAAKKRKIIPVPTRTVQPSSSQKSTVPPGMKNDNLYIATKLLKREMENDLQAQIRKGELEHSLKLELMSKHQTMTMANLKEEFQQKIHALKCEWDEERQKLWAEVAYLKDVLTRRPYF